MRNKSPPGALRSLILRLMLRIQLFGQRGFKPPRPLPDADAGYPSVSGDSVAYWRWSSLWVVLRPSVMARLPFVTCQAATAMMMCRRLMSYRRRGDRQCEDRSHN